MLAIQKIKMYWEKDNRTPAGAILRKAYYKPAKIAPQIALVGEGIFINERDYIQKDKIYLATDYQKTAVEQNLRFLDMSEAKEKEYRRQSLLSIENLARKQAGYFVSNCAELAIPGMIVVEKDTGYQVKWYSFEKGYQPVRTGYNEDYHTPGALCQGKRILCQTAFCLSKGEGGKLTYNYRYTSDQGQHYLQYCIYMLNIEKLEHHAFVKGAYNYQYAQMVDLF